MNQEWLDRLKAEPGVPGMTLMLIAEVERLQNELSLSGVVDTVAQFVAEIERLEAQNRALVEAMRLVIEQADLDAATRPKGGLANYYGFYEIVLTNNQVEALRMAMEDSR